MTSSAPAEPAPVDQARATEIAKATAVRERNTRGVGGQPLDLDRSSVEKRVVGERVVWYVVIPETNPTVRPNGLELTVQADTGFCEIQTTE